MAQSGEPIAVSGIDRILAEVPLPEMVRVRQRFTATPLGALDGAQGAVAAALAAGGLARLIGAGQQVAIAVGSRGIAGLAMLARELGRAVRAVGAEPFVVPAMGSHGGATAAGQLSVLQKLGVTEQSVGMPIRSSMEVVELGEAAPGLPLYCDRHAAAADATMLLGRVKPHVSYRGRYESGLMKMLAIGLGKQKGAETCHNLGFGTMARHIELLGNAALQRGNVVGGLAVVENALHQTHHLELLPAAAIPEREPELLQLAWELYPSLPFDAADVLVIDQIGKNISGTGFDTNVVGRYSTPFASGGPQITRIVVLDTTPETGGNVNGLGIVDITTRRVLDKLSFEETYPNALTSTVTEGVKIPMVMANDHAALRAAIRTANLTDPRQVRLARIRDTLSLATLEVSANMAATVGARQSVQVDAAPHRFAFSADGNLLGAERHGTGAADVAVAGEAVASAAAAASREE